MEREIVVILNAAGFVILNAAARRSEGSEAPLRDLTTDSCSRFFAVAQNDKEGSEWQRRLRMTKKVQNDRGAE